MNLTCKNNICLSFLDEQKSLWNSANIYVILEFPVELSNQSYPFAFPHQLFSISKDSAVLNGEVFYTNDMYGKFH